MTDEERMERGLECFRKVYGGTLPDPPKPDGNAFLEGMLKSLFAETWSRDILSLRDRRLLVIGVIAALGADASLFEIHARAAIANGELTIDDLREAIVMLTPYVGYPRATPLYLAIEKLQPSTGE